MGSGKGHILVLGQRSALLEGVSDLLRLVGYQVELSSDWEGATSSGWMSPPNLVIVDLSDRVSEAQGLPDQIHSVPRWSSVPLLFVGFSGDAEIDELQARGHGHDSAPTYFYVHSLLSAEGLVQKVQTCLS
jgi:response regulator RpfG family c-di-GMP phosphodiesterase